MISRECVGSFFEVSISAAPLNRIRADQAEFQRAAQVDLLSQRHTKDSTGNSRPAANFGMGRRCQCGPVSPAEAYNRHAVIPGSMPGMATANHAIALMPAAITSQLDRR